jgi:hypothetical protein
MSYDKGGKFQSVRIVHKVCTSFDAVTTSICMPVSQQPMLACKYSHPAKILNDLKVVVILHVLFPIDIERSLIT